MLVLWFMNTVPTLIVLGSNVLIAELREALAVVGCSDRAFEMGGFAELCSCLA